MSNFDNMRELINAMSGVGENTLAVNKAYLEFMGSLEGGVFLSQLIFYSDKSKRTDGFFYKTYEEWEKHTYLSEYNIRKQVKKLVEMKVLETKVMRANGNPTVHYKFDMDAFIPLFITFLKKRRNETENFNPVSEKPKERNLNFKDSITEITTENTTKNIDDEEEAPAEKFNLFMEYKSITGKTPNGIQSKLLMEWIAKFPSDVLQEGLKRMQEGTPDNPFNYLKKIMEYWEQKGLFTLQAIYAEDEKFKLNNQKSKGANQQPTNGGPAMVNGHIIDF